MGWLKSEFGVGVVDFSAYWFRRSVKHLRPGQRAGLVSTNTLRQNKHRRASLDHVIDRGGVITDAISTQVWPGEARVHVSITNWINDPKYGDGFVLDGRRVSGITAQLVEGQNAQEPGQLRANRARAFIGCYVRNANFQVPQQSLPRFAVEVSDGVVRPYLNGEDLVDHAVPAASRWIIDFGTLSLEEAARWSEALTWVRTCVRPQRESDAAQLRSWWQFWRPRPFMRQALVGQARYAAVGRTAKRFLPTWQDPIVCPSDSIVVFAFDDDYSMGVLLSRVHTAWAWARSATFKADLTYTPSSAFMTFPWPDLASDVQREAVAEACRRLLARRSELCLEHDVGLTKLYNAMDEGAYADLKALHRELDEAVADCYGWPKAVAQDDKALVARLTELNRQIVEGERDYRPFTYLDVAPADETAD